MYRLNNFIGNQKTNIFNTTWCCSAVYSVAFYFLSFYFSQALIFSLSFISWFFLLYEYFCTQAQIHLRHSAVRFSLDFSFPFLQVFSTQVSHSIPIPFFPLSSSFLPIITHPCVFLHTQRIIFPSHCFNYMYLQFYCFQFSWF